MVEHYILRYTRNGLYLLLALLLISCYGNTEQVKNYKQRVSSPDGQLKVEFQLKDGIPFYNVKKGGATLLNDSRLGLRFKEGYTFDKNFEIKSAATNKTNPAEADTGSLHKYNTLLITLAGASPQQEMELEFRVYNNQLAFRYAIPEQIGVQELKLLDELTEFSVTTNFDAYGIPASSPGRKESAASKNKIIHLTEAVKVPLKLGYADSLVIHILEAGKMDGYAGLTLINNGNNTLKTNVVRDSVLTAALKKGPLTMPWRIIQVNAKPVKSDAVL